MENKIVITITSADGIVEELKGFEVRQTVTENITPRSKTITTDRHFMLDDGSGYKVVMSKTTSSKG